MAVGLLNSNTSVVHVQLLALHQQPDTQTQTGKLDWSGSILKIRFTILKMVFPVGDTFVCASLLLLHIMCVCVCVFGIHN